MASENKRPQVNKVPVALPKADAAQPANTQPVSQDVGLQMAVGSRARVVTTQPTQTTIEGTIYIADPITNLLVLNTSPQAQTNSISPSTLAAPPGSYRLIPISQISSFQLLSLAQPGNSDTSKLEPASSQNTLDTTAISARLQRNVTAAQATQARQGPKGTSGVEQAVFDALSRQFQTRWEGNAMVISDQFIVEKPYEARALKLLPGATGDLDRMKRIYEMERKKAELKQPLGPISSAMGNGNSKGVPASGHRKGG